MAPAHIEPGCAGGDTLSPHCALALVGAHLETIGHLLDTGEPHHARHVVASAQALVARALAPPSHPHLDNGQHPDDSLSPAESRVLALLDSYRTLPQIAVELGVSRNTVKSHVRSIYAKLAVGSRADAVRAAQAVGVLAPSDH